MPRLGFVPDKQQIVSNEFVELSNPLRDILMVCPQTLVK